MQTFKKKKKRKHLPVFLSNAKRIEQNTKEEGKKIYSKRTGVCARVTRYNRIVWNGLKHVTHFAYTIQNRRIHQRCTNTMVK